MGKGEKCRDTVPLNVWSYDVSAECHQLQYTVFKILTVYTRVLSLLCKTNKQNKIKNALSKINFNYIKSFLYI